MNDSLVNWNLAAKIAGTLAPAGPKIAQRERNLLVEELRYAAGESVDFVYRVTGLEAAADLRDSEVLIVDRAGWAKANAQTFQVMLEPIADSLLGRRTKNLGSLQRAGLSYAGSSELGGMLAFLSTRVLGQYDPYAPASNEKSGGRLMLVAPNILAVERELNVVPQDFRLWVCLHEQTHRVQFAAAPWLREHMLDLIRQLTDEMSAVSENPQARVLDALKQARQSRGNEKEPQSAAQLVLSEQGRELFGQVNAVMSLLEGHANVVMDAVDSSVVPSVKTIRRRFTRRSQTHKFLTRFISKLMGMDQKMKQYVVGQKFVQHIVDARGMQDFNRVWLSARNLPTETEIKNPEAWMERVLGAPLEMRGAEAKAPEEKG